MLTDLQIEKEKNFEYGANIHQIGQMYKAQSPVEYAVLTDEELSYTDILDLKTGLDLASEFYDVKATVVVKYAMACAVALGADIFEACQKSFDTDPVSILDSCVVFSDVVDENVATLVKKMAFNIVAAPEFSQKALDILVNVEGLKVVKINTPLEKYRKLDNYEITSTPMGILVQSQDRKELDKDSFRVVSATKPTAEQIEDAVFAWKVAKHCKTQAVVIAKDFKTLAICQGNVNQACAFEQALDYACNDSKEGVLAIDTDLGSIESVHAAVQGRVSLIIQSGCCNEAVIKCADKYNLVMINTGITHIKY